MDPLRRPTTTEFKTWAAGAVLLLGVLALVIWRFQLDGNQAGAATGTILAMGGYTGEGLTRPLLVRVPDGTTRHIVVRVNQAAGCRVGGPISIVAVGGMYGVGIEGCNVSPDRKS
jgi:hypothetical protein